MAFQAGIQEATPVGSSGSTTLTSDLGIEPSTVLTAVRAFEGLTLSVNISGSAVAIREIADVYHTGLRQIHFEEMPP